MSDINERLAEVLAAHACLSSDEQKINGEWTFGFHCECGAFVPDIQANAHLAAALRPTVDALLAEARREALNEAANRVQKIYDLQCPPLSADTYVDRGAWVAHKWWDTVLGGELKRIREEATR